MLDFIDDINPRGNGKESTGLVTRFTRKGEPEKDPKFCVPLRLFGECDIAKILINSCFNDFDWHEVKRKPPGECHEEARRGKERQRLQHKPVRMRQQVCGKGVSA